MFNFLDWETACIEFTTHKLSETQGSKITDISNFWAPIMNPGSFNSNKWEWENLFYKK